MLVSLQGIVGVILTSATLAFCPAARADEGTLEISWVSSNDTVGALPYQIQALAVELLNSGLLPVRSVQVSAPDERVSVMFEPLFPFLTWTDITASLLCDLNASQCARPRPPAGRGDQSKPTLHILGTAFDSPDDVSFRIPLVGSGPTTSSVIVPDLAFSYQVNWRSSEVSAGKVRTSEVYRRDAVGCRAIERLGMPFDLRGQFPGLIDTLRAEPAEACPMAIFLRNHARIADVLGGAGNSPLSRNQVDALVGGFQQRLSDAPRPWDELDEIVEEVIQRSGRDSLPLSLPVLALSAKGKAPRVLYTSELPQFPSGQPVLVPWPNGDFNEAAAALNDRGGDIQVFAPGGLATVDGGAVPLEQSATELDAQEFHVLAEQKRKLFQYINFPWRGGLNVAGAGTDRLIVVVDQGFADRMAHCVFMELPAQRAAAGCDLKAPVWAGSAVEDIEPGDVRTAVADFFERDPRGQRLKIGLSHGHAVSSIAAARVDSGGMMGVDPHSLPIAFKVDLNQPGVALGDKVMQGKVKALRDQAYNGEFHNKRLYWQNAVWNLSFHTVDENRQPGNEHLIRGLWRYIRDVRQNAPGFGTELDYFVAAAGNVSAEFAAEDKGVDCNVFPACYVEKHPDVGTIITVVGAMIGDDGVPELWRSPDGETVSYYNPRLFQVAAIAQDVPLSLPGSGNAYTFDSGTSYAAPQVAGLVASLRAAELHNPTLIQARLMACARMSSRLVDHVRGGLIDVDCTLELRKDQMAYDDGNPAHKVLRTGELVQVWQGGSNRESGTVSHSLPEFRGELKQIGFVQPRPDPDKRSMAGFRTLSDDDARINIVGWLDKPPGKRGLDYTHAQVLTDTRVRLEGSMFFEFRFDGEDDPVCVPLSRITQFIAAAPDFARPLEKDGNPDCDPIE